MPKTTHLRPLFDRIVVKPIELGGITDGGIHLPETAAGDRTRVGRVLAVGKGLYSSDGTLTPMQVEVGDSVLYADGSGLELERDDKGLVMLRQNEILAIQDE